MEKLPHPVNDMGEPEVPQMFVEAECPQDLCPRFETEDCRRDRHHLYYPKSDYEEKVEKIFRGLHKLEICRPLHEYIHKTFEPPVKPSREYMLGYVMASGVNVPVSLRKQLKQERRA